MRSLINVFNYCFATRFYQAHLMVFLFFALAMFGMADGGTVVQIHYYILYTAFLSPQALIWLLLALLLYGLNGLRYMLNTLGKDEFRFLYTSNAAPAGQLFAALFTAATLINAPILVYGVAGIIIALTKKLFVTALAGALGLLAINMVVTARIWLKLVAAHRQPWLNMSRLVPPVNVKPGMLTIWLRHLTNTNKVAFIATKVFSCAVIYAAHYEWHVYNYDIRWMQVAMALSIPAQGILILQVWKFENTYLSFTRNFPVTITTHYLQLLALVLILLIPEGILLASYCYRFGVLWQWPVYMLYATGLPMLVYAMLFTRGFNEESYSGFLFAIALATFFVTLFGFTWLLALIFIAASYLVYREAYYTFEREMK